MAGMIPGLSGMMGGMDDEAGAMKLKRMIYICDSMTEKELDSDGKMFVQQPERMMRIARGSGTSVREVEDLLTQHKMMAGMAKKMGGGMKNMQRAGAGRGMMPGMGRGGRGEKQQMEAMQKRLQSMGGAGGMPGGMDMASMMKMFGGGGGGGGGGMPDLSSMMGGGGMPDMSSLMKMMGGGGMPGMGGRGRGR
ncbi:hypothetical protein LTS18_013694 [Coniosporium uncinatum]|uniref:Uncharacterized protein n=1 Tax=Coniosporium uncinatum TaxID=93489 RepID=A0ACC3CWK2_9PEZI|nr:hypothetical protein LTS18_013694 [Coniosporium uncinatum]